MSITRIRCERLADERARIEQNIEDMRRAAEEGGGRDLNDLEAEQIDKWRSRVSDLDAELVTLTEDLERQEAARDISALIRKDSPAAEHVVETEDGPVVYRTFSAYAMDKLIATEPRIAEAASRDRNTTPEGARQASLERLERALQNTLSSDVAGLVPPTHLAQIMDLINNKRPIIASSRQVDLSRGSLTYPKIDGRPVAAKQTTEKTQAGSIKMQVSLVTITADTFLAGGDLSWQTINWSTPDALQLWFDLAAESYAQQTETHAGTVLAAAPTATTPGTVSPALGTAGTETLTQWRAATIDAIGEIYTTTSGRAQSNTLYLSADQFFALAALGSDQVLQMSAVGNLDIGAMTGTFSGLRVVGSYGFPARTRIVGDSSAFITGENPGAPVELRAVEPSIGGLEVGLIGAFQAKNFDYTRFLNLNAHA